MKRIIALTILLMSGCTEQGRATDNASRWNWSNTHIKCAETDSDNDGMIACTITAKGTKTQLLCPVTAEPGPCVVVQ